MNPLQHTQAWVLAHKGVVAGGAGVAGLALFMRQRSKAAGSTALATTPASIAQPATADTSAYDTYNALNDQLTAWESSVQAQIDGLTAGGNSAPTPTGTDPAPTPAPVPAATPTPTPAAPAPAPANAAPATSPSGTYVSSGNQFVNGLYVGPAGVPYYSQAQLDAMTAAQRTKVYSGSYSVIPNDYAVPAYSAPSTSTAATQTKAGSTAPVAAAPVKAPTTTKTPAQLGGTGSLFTTLGWI